MLEHVSPSLSRSPLFPLEKAPFSPFGKSTEAEVFVASFTAYVARLMGVDEQLRLEIEIDTVDGEHSEITRFVPSNLHFDLSGLKVVNRIRSELREASFKGSRTSQWNAIHCRWIRTEAEGDRIGVSFRHLQRRANPSIFRKGSGSVVQTFVSDSLREIFDPAWLKESFTLFLDGFARNPETAVSSLPLLVGGEEEQSLLGRFALAQTHPEIVRSETLMDLFSETVRRYPNRTAVECGGQTLTYQELDRRASLVAMKLRDLGVSSGSLVGLFTERSCDAFVAMLGVLKARAAYVPMDPTYPQDRVDYILRDSKAQVLVSHRSLLSKLETSPCATLELESFDWSLKPEAFHAGNRPQDLAYVIYTSGSTGRPKGVMVEHRSICHLIRAEAKVFATRPSDRVYQGFSLAFDASLEEIWLAFFVGATLVSATSEEVFATAELPEFLNRNRITIFSTVPTVLSFMEGELNSVRTLILGGEAAPKSLIERWARAGRRVVNTYGPTEATVVATYTDCARGERVTIGTGLPNLKTYILNKNQEPVPVGSVGELYLGGPCLARGYLGQPELTKEKFVNNPFALKTDSEQRLYRTGDLARYTVKGAIEFMGRRDSQVKLRGFRIELSEIESVLLQCPGVTASAVTVMKSPLGIDQLVGFVVCQSEVVFNKQRALEILRSRMASYMIPSLIEQIAELPMLPSGKLDRKSLPIPTAASASQRTAVETIPLQAFADQETQVVYQIWTELFAPTPVVDPSDDFFALGGHSLTAAKLVSLLRQDPAFASVSVVDVYKYPTLLEFANRLKVLKDRAGFEVQSFIPSAVDVFQKSSVEHAQQRVAVSPRVKFACHVGQALGLFSITSILVIPFLIFLIFSVNQYFAGVPLMLIAFKFGVLALLISPLYIALAVLAKWVLIGKYKPGIYPIWGSYYLRFWMVNRIEGLIPLTLFLGSPLMTWYLKAMGAKIGKNVFIGTPNFRTYDLIKIGDDVTIEHESHLLGYSFRDGQLVIGGIELESGAHVSTKATLNPFTKIGRNGELAQMSLLREREVIAPGALWSGSPAVPIAQDHVVGEPVFERASWRSFLTCTALQIAMLLFVPFLFIPVGIPLLKVFLNIWITYGDIAAIALTPPLAAFGTVVFSVEIALIKWIVLGKSKPGNFQLYSFYYFRKWIVEGMTQGHLKLCNALYATLYLIPWFRLMGAKVGKRVEISTASHITADLLGIGDESFIADSACLGAPRVRRGRVFTNETQIGKRTFIGNSALMPSGSKVGDQCLVGVLSVPPDSEVERMQVGCSWLGSPPIRLPRRQLAESFSETSTYAPTRKLISQRLFVEFFRITLPPTLAFVSVFTYGRLFYILRGQVSETVLWSSMPFVAILCGIFFVGVAVAIKWILMGRYKPGQHPLWSPFVWKNELVTALHETFSAPLVINALQGTPWIAVYLRALGCKIGKGVVIETTHFTEFDLVEIGDRACLSANSTVQPHLFEDRVFKQSTLKIGSDCAVGPMSVVLYDSVMGDGSTIDALSLLMKGESISINTNWAGIPVSKC